LTTAADWLDEENYQFHQLHLDFRQGCWGRPGRHLATQNMQNNKSGWWDGECITSTAAETYKYKQMNCNQMLTWT